MLVDTNTIIEAHRTRAWAALAGGWRVETVEDCVTETQTGIQRRRPERSIAADELRASWAVVYAVTDRDRIGRVSMLLPHGAGQNLCEKSRATCRSAPFERN